MSTLLPVVDSQTALISKHELTQVFHAFAEKRQPRTLALVKGARFQGERRVVAGGTAKYRERDDAIAKEWQDENAVEAKYDRLFREPF